MKYLILAAALALAGCSGSNGLITGTITCDAATGICTLNGVQIGISKATTTPPASTVVVQPIRTVTVEK